RALAAAAARSARSAPATAGPVGVDDAGGARPCAAQPGALAADEPGAARADPRAVATDAARGARAAAPGAPAAPAAAPRPAVRRARGWAAGAVTGAALAFGVLSGCTTAKAGDDRLAPASAASAPPVAAAPAPTITGDRRIIHVLSRLTYGARPGDVEHVRAM